MQMTLADWIEERKLTDEKMAKLVGVSRATISRLKRGINKPTIQTLVRIVEVTNGAVSGKDFLD